MKRILLIILATALLLAVVSCGHGKTDEPTTTATQDESQPETDTKETGESGKGANVPADLTFLTEKGPADFKVLTQDYHAAITDFVVDASTTNAIEQEVFRRNAYAEERLGVFFSFQSKPYDQTNDAIRALWAGGDTSVDLVSARASWAVLMLTEKHT